MAFNFICLYLIGLSHPKKLYMTWNELLEVDGSEIYAED